MVNPQLPSRKAYFEVLAAELPSEALVVTCLYFPLLPNLIAVQDGLAFGTL